MTKLDWERDRTRPRRNAVPNPLPTKVTFQCSLCGTYTVVRATRDEVSEEERFCCHKETCKAPLREWEVVRRTYW